MRKILIAAFLTLIFFANFAYAQGEACSPDKPTTGLCNAISLGGATDIQSFIQALFGWLAGVIGTLVLVMLIFSGARMVVAQGNQDAIKQAKDSFTYAIFGFILIISSYVIVSMAQYFVGYNNLDPTADSSRFFNPLQQTNLMSLVIQTVKNFLGLLGVLGIFYIIIGGFRYMMAGGNEEQMKKAKQSITWAVIGMISILLSYTVVQTLFSLFYKGI